MKRCAIFTRKSHEEGLDQAFNSLDAQREAGIDYIKSQKHEGWQTIDQHYDDGGFTGGNMERPGLQELLQDIELGAVDVVVVYKVDRLSRSLSDFAQIMQRFDAHGVSFVSVTQQFNTTTSMGRLTLNMLLSFAQFEREVTGERIRDKLAATKKKGLWVTGQPPLGYQCVERKLVILPGEAELVRQIYAGYLEQVSLVELAARFNAAGHTTKHWLSTRNRWHGGKPLTPKYLYRILNNPIYIGKITHKDKVWPGQHEPIIPRELWDQVRQAMDQRERQTRHRWEHPHLLKGRLKTHEGSTMSPGAVHRPSKVKGQKRIVRYYVSQKAMREGYKHCPIKTINAEHLDALVRALVLDHLDDPTHPTHDLAHLRKRDPETRDFWLREVIHGIVLAPDRITIELSPKQIANCTDADGPELHGESRKRSACLYKPVVETHRGRTVLTLAIQIKRLDGKRLLCSPDGQDLFMPDEPEPKAHIVAAIGRAYHWRDLLTQQNLSLAQFTEQIGSSDNQIRKYLPLINLSPDILKWALTGELPMTTTLTRLLAAARYLDWGQQAHHLGLDHTPTSR
ncbi:MAG: recombinase family protein [Planctomycetota bacterium]